MTETNKLLKLSTSDLAGSDLFRLWSQKYGGEAALSLTNLNAYIASLATTALLTAQYEAPTATGFSVTVDSGNTWLVLTPAAGYAAGTIVLPTGVQGQEVLVNCTQAVTTLTITPGTGDTVVGAPATLAANDYFRLKYDDTLSRWYRVS